MNDAARIIEHIPHRFTDLDHLIGQLCRSGLTCRTWINDRNMTIIMELAYEQAQYLSVELIVTEPRLPCFKLNVKFQRDHMVNNFLKSRRTGFYFAVAREGEISAGDPIQFVSREQKRVSIADIMRLCFRSRSRPARLLSLPAGIGGRLNIKGVL